MDRTHSGVADEHGLTEARGFLPDRDPLAEFDTGGRDDAATAYLSRLDEVAAALPDLVEDGDLRATTEALDTPPEGLLDSLSEREAIRVCQIAGFLASAYVHDLDGDPVDSLPAGAAVPLYDCSKRFGREPILSYDLLCLHNFERRDPTEGFAVHNLDTLVQFRNLPDERWFVVIHVAIESAAGTGLVACSRAQQAIREDDPDALLEALRTLAESLGEMTAIMNRMTEGNAPSVFATEFRPFYQSFEGIVYEGVDELDGEPQHLRGGSGAQSSILPAMDETLGIDHESTILIEKLQDMRSYMPEHHRTTIEAFRDAPDVRPYVAEQDDPDLENAFNECIRNLGAFRRVHLGQVAQYIREETGETTGTGGTDYMEFLPVLREETESMLF